MSAIGPNAVTRIAEALTARQGVLTCQAVFARAGLAHRLAIPPTAMVSEREVADLYCALQEVCGPAEAAGAAAEAGRLTAEYLLANRIPKPAQFVLRHLPRRLALRLLCAAIARHAWTFAGSGRYSYALGRVPELRLHANPIARRRAPDPDGCHYHAAVFRQLLRALIDPAIEVHETACCANGAQACVFRLTRA